MAKVLVVGQTPPPLHGVSIATQLVLEILCDQYETIHLDTADRRDISNINKLDLENVRLAFAHGFQFLRLILSHNPDIVYLPIAEAFLPFLRDSLFLIPARALGKKVIVHRHGEQFGAFYQSCSGWMKKIIRFGLEKATCVIVLGEDLAESFTGIVPPQRIQVVPNGIDDFTVRYPCEGHSKPTYQILFLGSLMKEKGVFDILHAVPLVVEEEPQAKFIFAGEWYGRDQEYHAKLIIQELQIERYVVFSGAVGVPRKYELLQQADLFLLPSYAEGQPYAILEAMCAGLPVIATRTGAIPDTVVDGCTGFLVNKSAPVEIAERILLLLHDETLWNQMRQAGRERFLRYYTREQWSANLLDIFSQVLGSETMEDPVWHCASPGVELHK
jgi:glycosyltransferase involved in cell wall biosynthesis